MDREELIARITETLEEMEGKDLARLYNEKFAKEGESVSYDSLMETFEEE